MAKPHKLLLGLLLCLRTFLPSAQSTRPDFSGVWRVRANSGPESLVLVAETGGVLHIKTLSRDGSRYTLTDAEFVIGATRTGSLQRMPAEFKANWDGEALVLDWTATWPWGPQSEHHRWTMSVDRKSFRDDFSDTFKARVRQHSADFDREPDDRSNRFDLPEQTAGQHYKNVQILRELPSSAVIPLMGTFQTALGVECQHCHNQAAYDSDEKPSKRMARKMILMTADLNHREFEGREAITCLTCHRGKAIPAP